MRGWLALAAWWMLASPAWAADTVAVLYFTHSEMNPELSGLKVGLAQMLITDLTGTAGLEVVERERLQAILDELKLGHDGIADPSSAARVGKLLGARFMVLGGYFQLGETLRVDARVVEVETSRIVGSHGVNGSVAQFLSMESELADFAKRTLTSAPSAPGPSPSPAPAPKTREGSSGAAPVPAPPSVVAPDPQALAAAVAFSDGLIFLDAGDAPKARESFERAVAASPALDDAKAALAKLTL
jgi:TolB-like protein